MVNRVLLLVGAALAMVGPVRAEVRLHVRSYGEADFYIDGRLLATGRSFSADLSPGVFRLAVVDLARRAPQEVTVVSPTADLVERTYVLDGDGVISTESRVLRRFHARRSGQRSIRVDPLPGNEVVCPDDGQYYPPEYRQPAYRDGAWIEERERDYRSAHERAERDKVRMRNVLLGVGVANEAFNHGHGRQGVRTGVLGGVLLNEALHRR